MLVLSVMARTCLTCGASIEHKKANAKYCSPRCSEQSPKAKATRKRYSQSPKRKAATKRYQQSPQGKAAWRRAVSRQSQKAKAERHKAMGERVCVMCGVNIAHRGAAARYCSLSARKSSAMKRAAAKYAKSAKGKTVNKRHRKSSKGKTAEKRYAQSPKGVVARREARARHKRKIRDQNSDTEDNIDIEQHLGDC